MQCTDNDSINSEHGGDEDSLVDVDSNVHKQENQEKIPMEETAMSDGTSITSMEDALEPNNDLPSEAEDMSNNQLLICQTARLPMETVTYSRVQRVC